MTGCPHKPKFSYKTTKKSKTVFFRLVTFRVLGQKLYWLYICWIWDTSQLRLCSIEATLAPSTQTAPVRSRADAQNFLCSVGDIAELFPSFSGAIFVKIRPVPVVIKEGHSPKSENSVWKFYCRNDTEKKNAASCSSGPTLRWGALLLCLF